jgi:hypothetical protein
VRQARDPETCNGKSGVLSPSCYFTVSVAGVECDSVLTAGGVALNVAKKLSVKVPLLEFFADAEMNIVFGVVTVTEIGVVQVVFGSAGDTLQASDTVPVNPLIGVRVSV